MRYVPPRDLNFIVAEKSNLKRFWSVPVVLALCAGLVLADAPAVRANGFFDFLMSGKAPTTIGSDGAAHAYNEDAAPTSSLSGRALSHKAWGKRHVRHKGGKASVVAAAALCVRASDGYFFPAANSRAAGDLKSQQAYCESQCPNLDVRLFLMPKNSDKIEDAKDARSGELYSKISAKFSQAELNPRANACHPVIDRIAALRNYYHDRTLRRGDLVVTAKGIRVFRGARQFPYSDGDFVSASRSRDLPSSQLYLLAAMERAMKTARW